MEMMDDQTKQLYLERGRALLESRRSMDINRSPEETERLKQRGRLLLSERKQQQLQLQQQQQHQHQQQEQHAYGDGTNLVHNFATSSTDYFLHDRVEEGTEDGMTDKLPNAILVPKDSVMKDHTDTKSVSTSLEQAATVNESSLLDSVQEKHTMDIKNKEILKNDSYMSHENLDKQLDEISYLKVELAKREEEIERLIKESKNKISQEELEDIRMTLIHEYEHVQHQMEAKYQEQLQNTNKQYMDVNNKLHQLESLLESKTNENQELLLQLQEEKTIKEKLQEENQQLSDRNKELEKELSSVTTTMSSLQQELTCSQEELNSRQNTIGYLLQQLDELQSTKNTDEGIDEEFTKTKDMEYLLQQCAAAEQERVAAVNALQSMKAELEGQRQRIHELEKPKLPDPPRAAAPAGKN
ncbi:uncharacterized protein TM35_000122270, partial [Trypanosoma theileri]